MLPTLLLLLVACQPQLSPPPSGQAVLPEDARGFGLAFSGNVDGEIEPCG